MVRLVPRHTNYSNQRIPNPHLHTPHKPCLRVGSAYAFMPKSPSSFKNNSVAIISKNFFFQRRQWLDNALRDLTVSPVERMKVGLRILTTAESTEQQMIDALDEIIEWCENLDFAAGKNMYQTNLQTLRNTQINTSKFEIVKSWE